jgi:hypothetical protein
MPERRPANTKPDLSPAQPTTNTSEPPAVECVTAEAENPASQQRYLLPKDLAGALKRLDDTEVDTLLTAVATEAERRGRLPSGRKEEHAATDANSQRHQPPAESGAGSLTKSQMSAVRAAFRAGVKPSAIARQFGISQSDIRKALAAEGQTSKFGR